MLPFGRGSSRGHFVRYVDAVTRLHQLSGPAHHSWNPPFAFRPSMFVDDGLFIDARMGDRRDKSVYEWGTLANGIRPDEATNEEKGGRRKLVRRANIPRCIG